jgi:hypothetical protein
VPAKKVTKKKAVKKAPAKKAAKKKAAPKATKIERLTAAGVIRKNAKHDPKVLNKLSEPEVKTLIKLRAKFGPLNAVAADADGGDDDQGPNFPV